MEAPRGSFCRECRTPILDEYYDVDGNVVCSACHAGRTLFRSRLLRGLKALLLGSLAAAVGAGGYRMILFGSGWNFSIVAILVGYMVGGAVRTGSVERGGRFYQFLAVFLTYSALVGMFLPDLWRALSSSPQKERVAEKRIEKEIQSERREEAAALSSAGAKAKATPAAGRSQGRRARGGEGQAGGARSEGAGRRWRNASAGADHGSSVVPGCDAALHARSHGRSRLFGSHCCRDPITDLAVNFRDWALAGLEDEQGDRSERYGAVSHSGVGGLTADAS